MKEREIIMTSLYTVRYVLKSDIEKNGKFAAATDIKSTVVWASDATRALSSFISTGQEEGAFQSKGDIKVLEIKLGL